MKKIFALLALATMLLSACGNDDSSAEETAIFTIDAESISIFAHDEYKITPSEAFTAQSANDDIASVSEDGTIRGISAGETDIVFTTIDGKHSQTCRVNVDWRYKYFDDPLTIFGATAEEIKARETHRLIADHSETRLYLVYDYSDQDIPMTVTYIGGGGRSSSYGEEELSSISFTWSPADGAREKIEQQVVERIGTFNEFHGCYYSERTHIAADFLSDSKMSYDYRPYL